MDIRNWFKRDNNNTSKKTDKPSGRDTKQPKDAKSKKRKKTVVLSDSEDESDFHPKAKTETKTKSEKSPQPSTSAVSKKSKKTEEKQAISVSDFFGSAPVRQSKKRSRDELFEKTLDELDTRNEAKKTATLSSKLSKQKETNKRENSKNDEDIIDLSSSPAESATKSGGTPEKQRKDEGLTKRRKISLEENQTSDIKQLTPEKSKKTAVKDDQKPTTSKITTAESKKKTTQQKDEDKATTSKITTPETKKKTTPQKDEDKATTSKITTPDTKKKTTPQKDEEKTTSPAFKKKTPEKKVEDNSKNTNGTKSPEKVKSAPEKAKPLGKEKVESTAGVTPGKANGDHSHAEEDEFCINPTPVRGASFRSYLNREGPRALGSREIPEGAPNCLHNLTFVLTGILETIDRDDMKAKIESLGGKVTQSVSKKTTYLVHGRDAGPGKTTKAQKLGVKLLDEDQLFELISSKPAGPKSKISPAPSSASKSKTSTCSSTENWSPPKSNTQGKGANSKADSVVPGPSSTSSKPSVAKKIELAVTENISEPSTSGASTSTSPSLLLVDKYKPQTMKQIIGQQGDKSNVKRLAAWLTNWHKNNDKSSKATAKRWGDDSVYRAALLSGPPGIGKTTTAQVVCTELGWSFVELNASVTRSKKSMQEWVSSALACGSLDDPKGLKHCLVMDEVDGMAGNEDRGGMQELISLIKTSKIPIICMCNDRQSQKVRSLANYCMDLRFQRPRQEQIKGMLMSVAFKEGIKVDGQVLNQLITSSSQDIRQCLHHLSLWSQGEQTEQSLNMAQKDIKLGPFEVCRQVFLPETGKRNLNQQAELFFHDYSLSPLFVQENYIQVSPVAAKGNAIKTLECLSECADSLASSDLVDRCIRSANNWSLLPVQAMYASVLPGYAMRGFLSGMIQFPSWLGKHSTTGKNHRLLQELGSHMALVTGASPRSLNLDYLPTLRRSLTYPLEKDGSEGVPRVLDTLTAYDMLKDDMDNVLELSSWPGRPQLNLPPAVKSALTRGYNKLAPTLPYSLQTTVTKKSRNVSLEGEEEQGENGSESEEEDNVKKDAMVKAKAAKKQPAAKKTSAPKKETATTSKKTNSKGKQSKKK